MILLLSNQLLAQQTKLEKTADIISYGTVATQLTLATIHNARSEFPKRNLIKEAGSIGIAITSSEIIKRFIHEDRPDKSDNKSFWSEHTAIAASVSGWNNSIGISLTIGTGTGRVIAHRHYWWDVAAGYGIGLLAREIVR